MAMKENSLRILNYLKENNGKKLTTDDVADALGLSKRSIVGSFNSFVKKGWAVRTETEIEQEDGTHPVVKLLSLTEDGMAYNPEEAE